VVKVKDDLLDAARAALMMLPFFAQIAPQHHPTSYGSGYDSLAHPDEMTHGDSMLPNPVRRETPMRGRSEAEAT